MLAVLASSAHSADSISSKAFTVVDGNRLSINGRTIRLTGIIAPEPGRMCVLFGKERDCGIIAKAGLSDLTAGATIVCHKAADVEGAPAHRCTAGGYDLSEGMVYTGWAVPLEGAPKAYWRVLDGARGDQSRSGI